MKEAIIINPDGYMTDVTLVADDVTGVFPIHDQSTGSQATQAEEHVASPDPVLTGYTVAMPVPTGLYKPRFDFDAWEVFTLPQDYSRDEDGELLLDEFNQPIPLPRPQMQFWVEGLTQEELDELQNRPLQPTPEERIIQLEVEKAQLEQRLQATEGAILTLMDLV